MKKATLTMLFVFAFFAMFPITGAGQKPADYQLNFKNQQQKKRLKLEEEIFPLEVHSDSDFESEWFNLSESIFD